MTMTTSDLAAKIEPDDIYAHCKTDVCEASKTDGVLCADGECDRENGVRPLVVTPEFQRIVNDVLTEVERATRKFPTWPTDLLHALAVVNEEAGELQKAALQTIYEPHKLSAGELRTEVIQMTAMGLRFLASFDRYEIKPCEQHHQVTLFKRTAGEKE